MAVNSLNKKWERQQTYGGRLTENAVQGLCRDLLVHAALRLEQGGYRPLTLIHDEVVCEPPVGFGSVDSMCAIMSELPAWAEGFPLRAEGSRGPRYMKS
jgi:DNA polymerase